MRGYRSWWRPLTITSREGKNDIDLIKKQLLLTRKLAKEVHPKMQICLGMEIYYGEDVPELLKTGKAVSIRKSRYILWSFRRETISSIS